MPHLLRHVLVYMLFLQGMIGSVQKPVVCEVGQNKRTVGNLIKAFHSNWGCREAKVSVFYLNITVLNIFISFHYLKHIYILAAPFKKTKNACGSLLEEAYLEGVMTITFK